MIEVSAILVIAIILRILVIAFMYNLFIELIKFKCKTLALIYASGLLSYTIYTFGTHIGQDIADPIRTLAVAGLALMLGATFAQLRSVRIKRKAK